MSTKAHFHDSLTKRASKYLIFAAMKNGIVLLLVLTFGILTIRNTIVLVYFKINQDFITENFCRNKRVIGSTCAGTCQLKDLLLEVEQEDPSIPFPILPSWKVEEYFLPHYSSDTPALFHLNPAHLARFYNEDLPEQLRQLGIFHPPRLLS